MPRVSLVLVFAALHGIAPAAAQTPEVELHVGAGYVRDSGEGPSVPGVAAGGVLWLAQHVGIGGRYVHGIGNDHFDPPVQGGDRIFFGPGALRMWSATVHGRWSAHGMELNLGVGWGGHSYEYEEILTGIRRADGSIDPLPPMTISQRYRIGFIATEVLVGRRLAGPFHLKGGFTYGLAGDTHPLQPLVLLSVKAR